MKRKYAQPLVRIIELESNGIIANSPIETDHVSVNEEPADKMESNHRKPIWNRDGIWK